MKEAFESYLFDRHFFVHDPKASGQEAFPVMFALANLFGIRIVSGRELLQRDMISTASKRLGIRVPEPFYRGFPKSVRRLSPDKLLFDQLAHYTVTYGFGHFEGAGHSLFEHDFERAAFKEETPVRDFSVLTLEEAEKELAQIVNDLLAGSRPLSDRQYTLVFEYLKDHRVKVAKVGSKLTAVRLMLDLGDMQFAAFLSMPDVIRVVDELNYRSYGSEDMHQLNLKNRDRKFITALIDAMFESGRIEAASCCEKKQLWNGLLHHIHYKAKTDQAREFVNMMRGGENHSVYAAFEQKMAADDIPGAIAVLKEGKGGGALLRNINYILSRCRTPEEFEYAAGQLDTKNVILLIQLLMRYSRPEAPGDPRTFAFTKHEMIKVYQETDRDAEARKSRLSGEQCAWMADLVSRNLKQVLKGRLGKVYIDPAMKNYALPVRESASQGGLGVLARGSRIHIGEAKKIRAFTYWEKVNDIDLSVIGIRENGRQTEFSWRTMAHRQSNALTYSGDETSGFNGGSEYFDVEVEAFKRLYPQTRYLVFCDNVYSGIPFDRCVCRAGYMIRDIEDSGQVFEPKTVRSAFSVNCSSTFAYLFGLDLEKGDLIWLNTARSGSTRVAGDAPAGFLLDDFHLTEVINMYTFFEMMASEMVTDPADAEVIVTDKTVTLREGAQVIREYDFERMIALMNM